MRAMLLAAVLASAALGAVAPATQAQAPIAAPALIQPHTSPTLESAVPENDGPSPADDWALPLDHGGLYGELKWLPGNGTDVFMPCGTPVYAMFNGTVKPYAVPYPGGIVPGLLLNGDNGYSMQGMHVRLTAEGFVRKGQVIGIVDDPGLDVLGPYPGTPGGDFQHLDLTIGRGPGPFPLYGGDLNAARVLGQLGYQGQVVPQTLGPNNPIVPPSMLVLGSPFAGRPFGLGSPCVEGGNGTAQRGGDEAGAATAG
jgi:hypothetical protein